MNTKHRFEVMSASGEAPADEDPGVADTENNDGGNEAPYSDTETEPAMLEEEEMPTYMSITSSSRLDESRAEVEMQRLPEAVEAARGERPRPVVPYDGSDDQAGDCVYVVSSGDESDRRPFDEDDMEDYESDEMEMEEAEEEEEEDEDDSHPELGDEDEEDSDADIEQFERSSDDCALRYDSGLEKHHKTRSRSLQDLTNSRSNMSRFVGKRRSIDLVDNYSSEFATQKPECLRDTYGEGKKISRSKRYDAVPSKVKMYIQDLKELSRRSMERKNRENPAPRNLNEAKAAAANVETSCTRINPANRHIKGYLQNAMKQMIAAIPEEAKNAMDRDMRLQAAEIMPQLQTNVPNNLSKNEKTNGLIVDFSTNNHVEKMVVEPMETCVPNGQQEQIAAIFNLRTLSYEEYANGDETSAEKAEEAAVVTPRPTNDEKNGVAEEQVIGLTEKEQPAKVATSLKTETVKVGNSVPEEAQGVCGSSDFPKSASHEIPATNRDGTDVAMLWAMLNKKTAQLNEKTAQYDGIREAFQNTLTENISLKREMEELKKTLAKYQKENEPRETKTAAVQTEIIPEIEETVPKLPVCESKALPPKLLTTSVGSALSSIEQWSDSNCSPAISINPPNMDTVLNSDDSLVVDAAATPCKPSHRLSQSFITSSRILQTLANITQGRTKATSSLASRNAGGFGRDAETRGQSKQEFNSPHVSGHETTAARSKKRKASDMLSPSEYEQSFKIPYTPGEPRRKVNSDFETDAALKSAREQDSRTSGQTDPAGSQVDESSERLPNDFEDTGATDVPENVKCFVYREEADCKERSFLIQAEESPSNSQVGGKGGTVRECGPYLLGNVEIRMTEANGTINIWGKEVSQDSDNSHADQDTEDSGVFREKPPSSGRRDFLYCQKTPRSKFPNGSSPFVCSTNKKSKDGSSHFGKSGIGKYFRPALSNLARASNLVDEGQPGHYRSSPTLNNRTSGCEHCECPKKSQRFNWPSCDHLANSRRKQQQHSCCIHAAPVEANERDCESPRDHDCCGVFDGDDEEDDDAIYETVSTLLTNNKKFVASCHNVSAKHSCAETSRRQRNSHSRRSPDSDGDCRHVKKRRSSCTGDVSSCNQRLTPGQLPYQRSDNVRSRSHSRHDSCDDEDHPLISHGQNYETPETKRRRLSGKKVRGILTDLLRGCGGCRDPSSTSFVAKESSSRPNCNPSVRVTPCTPPSFPSCSKSSAAACGSHTKHPPRDVASENGCSSCARRIEMTAEIESKLEILTVEMERLRSRSDTFRGMLDLLNSETD